MVYINTLAVNRETVPYSRTYMRVPASQLRGLNSLAFEPPVIILRRSWDKINDMPKNVTSSMDNDGILCVTEFTTLRLKKPTIDLLHWDGLLHMLDTGKMTSVARGSGKSAPSFTIGALLLQLDAFHREGHRQLSFFHHIGALLLQLDAFPRDRPQY